MIHRAARSSFLAGRRQRGAAALITMLFLLIVVAFAVLVSLNMSGSDVSDSAYQHNSVHALFLAESALETATYNYTVGGCSNAGIGTSVTPISLGNGGFTRVSAAVVGANCQIRASGTVGAVTRTVDGTISMSTGGAIAPVASSGPVSGQRPANIALTLAHTIPPSGASILLVGVSFKNTQNNSVPTATVNYGATPMLPAPPASGASPWPRAQIWYLINPPVGTATVSVSIDYTSEIVLGAKSFSGVNTNTGVAITPFDVAVATNSGAGNPKAATVPITPVTSGAWVFEVATMDNYDLTTMTPQANRTYGWFAQSNGNVRGAASTIGPISPASAQNPEWTWIGNNAKWSHTAVALRPGGGGPQLVRWTEVVQ